ncbi:MAG: MOSC domain-containing protein [Verrucomicrobiota bacterium]
MNTNTFDSPALPSPGKVESLHVHPPEPGAPMVSVDFLDLVAQQGIRNDPRYFARLSRKTGQPTRRQVSLIEREQIAEHAAVLGLQSIAPGAVRSNIETTGIQLVSLLGQHVRIGDAVLLLYDARTPCQRMDDLCQGLRQLMESQRQGVMAEVIKSGRITIGDAITLEKLPASR